MQLSTFRIEVKLPTTTDGSTLLAHLQEAMRDFVDDEFGCDLDDLDEDHDRDSPLPSEIVRSEIEESVSVEVVP